MKTKFSSDSGLDSLLRGNDATALGIAPFDPENTPPSFNRGTNFSSKNSDLASLMTHLSFL